MVNLNSEIRRFNYPDGSIQDVQIVSFDSFDDLHFLSPEYSPEAFYALCDLYKKYFIPRFRWYYEKVVLFRLPEDLKIPRLSLPEKYGEVKEDLTRVNIAFRENCYLKNGKIRFRDVATWINFFTISVKEGDKGWYYETHPVPHGTLSYVWYDSPTLAKLNEKDAFPRRLAVYTPPGYEENPKVKYPVLYLLHGSGGDEDA